jgi:hypothetical protein
VVEVDGEQSMLVGNVVVSVELGQNVEVVPLSESGNEILIVTGNETFDVTLVMFGKLMVAEELILVQEAQIEIVKVVVVVVVVEAVVFVLVPDSDVLLWNMV